MAAGVVSGAIALLLEQRPKLSPRETKTVLQVTSSLVSREGLITAGAGSLNALAASVFLADHGAKFPAFLIRGEDIRLGGIATFSREHSGLDRSKLHVNASSAPDELSATKAFLFGNSLVLCGAPLPVERRSPNDDSIEWGNAVDSIVWGNAADSIVWGNAADSIVWGNTSDSIVWGNVADSIVWGNTVGTFD